jgi:hypothetical protein
MAQEFLHRSDVVTFLMQVRGEVIGKTAGIAGAGVVVANE